MTRKLTSREFIECWRKFAEENKDTFLEKYSEASDWTKLVIGKAQKETNTDSPFGKFFIDCFGEEYTYVKEDADVDLSIYKDEYVKDIYSFTKNEFLEKYPINYDILLEHENDYKGAHDEMYKLTYYRATLKVLITYLPDGSTENNQQNVHDRLTNNFQTIIEQTNKKYLENIDTKYILITGQRFDMKEIKSTYTIFHLKSDKVQKELIEDK